MSKEEREKKLPFRVEYEQNPNTKVYTLHSVDSDAIRLIEQFNPGIEFKDIIYHDKTDELVCKSADTKVMPRDISEAGTDVVVFYDGKTTRKPLSNEDRETITKWIRDLNKLGDDKSTIEEKEKMLKGLIAPFVIENGIQSLTGRYKHRKIFLDLNGNEEGQVVSTRIKADYDQGDIYSLKDLLDEHPECVDLYKSCLNKVGFISDEKLKEAKSGAGEDLLEALDECLVTETVERTYVNKSVLQEKLKEYPELKGILKDCYTETKSMPSDEEFERIYPKLPKTVRDKMETLSHVLQLHPKTKKNKEGRCMHCGEDLLANTNKCSVCGNITEKQKEDEPKVQFKSDAKVAASKPKANAKQATPTKSVKVKKTDQKRKPNKNKPKKKKVKTK